MEAAWALVGGAYLLGAFPTAALVSRREGHDPTREGSGNPGASNVYRTAGRRAGALVLAGDVAKGALGAGIGLAAGPRGLGVACGVAAVVGHVLPPARRRGGKGVATAAGAMAVLHPLPSIALAGLWLVLARLTRTASIASIATVACMPIAAAIAGAGWLEVAALAGCAALVVGRHRDNITRLRAGQEHRVGPR